MPRNKIFSTIDSPFSHWHRNQHDGINMVDVDVVGICPGCAKPLFLSDTIGICKPSYLLNQNGSGIINFLPSIEGIVL